MRQKVAKRRLQESIKALSANNGITVLSGKLGISEDQLNGLIGDALSGSNQRSNKAVINKMISNLRSVS